MTNEQAGPLEGLRVIEIGDQAELAGKLLADAGADVIRVEPREGVRSRHVGPYVGGPWRDWASTDLVQLALGGPMMSTGYDDHELPPIRSDGEHSIAMSNEYAVTAVLAALWLRDEGGGTPGQLVDVSIHEAVSATTEGAFPNWEFLGNHVIRQTGRHAAAQRNAPWQYRCTDGDYILLMGGGVPREQRIFDELLEWMDEYDAARTVEK